jgi:SAM-dependent methyltransferase
MPPRKKYLNPKIKEAHEEFEKRIECESANFIYEDNLQSLRNDDFDVMGWGYNQKRGFTYRHRVVRYFMEKYYLKTWKMKRLLEVMISRKKGKFRVLDLGAGVGNFIKDLKKMFGNKIEGHANVIHATKQLKTKERKKEIDKIIEKPFEEHNPKTYYDLIVSNYGVFYYSKHPDIVLRKIAFSLEKKGLAILHYDKSEYGMRPSLYYNKIQDALSILKKEDNFVIRKTKLGGQEIMSIYRKS